MKRRGHLDNEPHAIKSTRQIAMPRIIPTAPPGTTEREILEVLRDRGSGMQINLVARFAPAIGKQLLETRLSVDQASTTLNDGRIEIRARVPDSGRLRWWLRGFGSNVEIVNPEGLRNAFRGEARAMLRCYTENPGPRKSSHIFGSVALPDNIQCANDEQF